MKRIDGLFLIIAIFALTAGIFLFSCTDDQDEEEKDFECAGGDYELVLDVVADLGQSISGQVDQLEFQYNLIENDDDFLYGKVFDRSTGKTYAGLGETQGENSYIVTFSPGNTYLDFECEKQLSFTLDIKDLTGDMIVYCDLEKLAVLSANAQVICDDTGISI